MRKNQILIADKDYRFTNAITAFLEDCGYQLNTVYDKNRALVAITENSYQVIIADYELTEGAGFFTKVKNKNPDTKVLFTSAHPSVDNAVLVMKAGAVDFLIKPIELSHIGLCINKLFCKDNNTAKSHKKNEIITRNKKVIELLSLAKQVADSTASVFISGESGTGKELFARFIHENSKRRNKPFVAVNCAALPDTLLESELFGYEKGAFTGAHTRKPGKFELANGGTLLLDETTEMQIHLQAKLLRVLQEKEVDSIGSAKPKKVDIRVIATSNRDVKQAVAEGTLRKDLYYRLNIIPINIPPLRDRVEDIGFLANYFIKKYSDLDGINVKSLTPSALSLLESHKFDGNIRELENIIHRAVLLSKEEKISENDLLMESAENILEPDTLEEKELSENFSNCSLKDIEKKCIIQTLDKTGNNRTQAAKILGISVRTLRNKLNEYKEKANIK